MKTSGPTPNLKQDLHHYSQEFDLWHMQREAALPQDNSEQDTDLDAQDHFLEEPPCPGGSAETQGSLHITT